MFWKDKFQAKFKRSSKTWKQKDKLRNYWNITEGRYDRGMNRTKDKLKRCICGGFDKTTHRDRGYLSGRDAVSNLGKWIHCDAFHTDVEFIGIMNKLGLSKVGIQAYMIPRPPVITLLICVTLNKFLNLQASLVCIMEVIISVLHNTCN